MLSWEVAVGSFTIRFVPVVLLNAAAVILRKGIFDLPFWFWAPCALGRHRRRVSY
jgi:uncharacterized membrane protein YhdT